jgi:hypothetical protein
MSRNMFGGGVAPAARIGLGTAGGARTLGSIRQSVCSPTTPANGPSGSMMNKGVLRERPALH